VDGADGDLGAGGDGRGVGWESGSPDFAADFYLADMRLASGIVGGGLAGDRLAWRGLVR